jgi:hypothetical protein
MAGALLATTGRHAPSAAARSWVQATTAQTARQALSALRGIGRHQIDADDPVVHRAEGDRGELPACRAQGGEHRGGRATPGSGAACAARPLGSRCSGMRVEPFLARPALSNLGICTIGNAASEIHRDRAGLGPNRPLQPARRARHLARDGRSRRRGRWRRPCDLVGERRAPGRIGLTEFARRVWPRTTRERQTSNSSSRNAGHPLRQASSTRRRSSGVIQNFAQAGLCAVRRAGPAVRTFSADASPSASRRNSARPIQSLAERISPASSAPSITGVPGAGGGPSMLTGSRRFLMRPRYFVRAVSSWPM